ncbi:MAG: tyrosine-type recombinase/integrase [Thermoplasmatota archaeon]
MTFKVQVHAGEARHAAPTFRDHAEVFDAWEADSRTRLQPATLKGYGIGIRAFLDAWPSMDFLKASHKDILLYMERFSQACRHYHLAVCSTGQRPVCLKGQDLAQCSTQCAAYHRRPFPTCMAHFTNIIHLYKFLLRVGSVNSNPAIAARDEWKHEHKHLLEIRRKRCPTREEVSAFLGHFTKIYEKFAAFALAKWGLRESELVRLQVSKLYFDKGYMEIPFFNGKRKGNRILILDDEARMILRDYLVWRGESDSDLLLLNRYKRPLKEEEVARRIMRASLNLGFESPGDDPKDRIRPHSFRHFFSTEVKSTRRGQPIDEYWWKVLRGDRTGGNADTYVHPSIDELRIQFLRHAPLLFT